VGQAVPPALAFESDTSRHAFARSPAGPRMSAAGREHPLLRGRSTASRY